MIAKEISGTLFKSIASEFGVTYRKHLVGKYIQSWWNKSDKCFPMAQRDQHSMEEIDPDDPRVQEEISKITGVKVSQAPQCDSGFEIIIKTDAGCRFRFSDFDTIFEYAIFESKPK